MKRLGSLLAVFALIACTDPTANAAPIEIKVGITTPVDSPLDLAVKNEMAEFVKARSNGKYAITAYPGCALGQPDAILQALQRGSVEFAIEGSANWSTQIPELGAFDLPYVFMSKDDAIKYFESESGKKLAEICEKRVKRVKFMGIECGGFRQICTTKYYPTLESLKGIPLRSTASKLHISAIRSLGMNPIPVAPSEMSSALQQGIIVGTDGEVSGSYAWRQFDICKFNLNPEHIAMLYVTLASSKWWEGLSDEDRHMFEEAVQVYRKAFVEHLAAKQAETFEKLKNEGVTSTWWTAEEKAKAAEMSRSSWEEATPEQRAVLEDVTRTLYNK